MAEINHKWKFSRKKIMPNQIEYKYQSVYLQKSLFHSLLPNKTVLLLLTSPNNKIESELSHNTTATFDKLACTDYMDFGKNQEIFGRLSWSENFFDYLDVKLKVFKKEKNEQFRLAQN